MAVAKNKNIRSIHVDGVQYYWSIQYDEDYGIISCIVGLYAQRNHRFYFFRGATDKHKRYIMNGISEKDEVDSITPKLVREAIIFANENIDWKHPGTSRICADAAGFSIHPSDIA